MAQDAKFPKKVGSVEKIFKREKQNFLGVGGWVGNEIYAVLFCLSKPKQATALTNKNVS